LAHDVKQDTVVQHLVIVAQVLNFVVQLQSILLVIVVLQDVKQDIVVQHMASMY
jgi:hypothetical protein